MADNNITFDDYKYAQKLRIYNDENRENVGFNDVWMADGEHYWHTDGATLGLYTIDCTVPPAERDWILLCSYKNGYTVKMKMYSYDPMYSDEKYSIAVNVQMFDPDGNQYGSPFSINNIEFDKFYNNPQSSQFLFSPPGFVYQLEYGDHPSGWNEGAIFTICNRPVGAGLRPAPDIRNTRIKVNGLDGAHQWWGYYSYSLSSNFDNFMNWIGEDGTPKKPDDDTSKPDEGDPDYDPDPDPIDFPDLPDEGDALSTGFIAVYQPTSGQLQSLALQLWSNDFITTFRKAYNDPIEAIVSLHSIPFQIVTGSNANCMIGNYDTNISMLKVAAQYYTINCGTIFVSENWASALDYSPYTQVEIFLPFVGIRPLNIDDIMGKNLQVRYNIDILTGGGIAMIKCADSVLYSFPCEVSQDIPYTMSSKMSLYTNVAQLVVSGVTAMAAPSPGTIGAVASSAINVASGKQTGITRGGTLGGNIGVLGEFTPYLIIHKPIQSLAADFAHKKGYPSNITASLASISGYTEIDKIHLENIPCTDSERDEIERLLKEGVIL